MNSSNTREPKSYDQLFSRAARSTSSSQITMASGISKNSTLGYANSGHSSPLRNPPSQHVLRRQKSPVAQRSPPSEVPSEDPVIATASLVSLLGKPMQDECIDPDVDHQRDLMDRRRGGAADCHATKSPQIIPELDRYRSHVAATQSQHSFTRTPEVPFKISTYDLPPPTPGLSALSGYSRCSASEHSANSAYTRSPATHYTMSPGPGPYSRETTPTSVSSRSPGFIAPALRMTPRLVQLQASQDKSRPPLTRRRTGSMSKDIDASPTQLQGTNTVQKVSPHQVSTNGTKLQSRASDVKASSPEKKRRFKLSKEAPSPPDRDSSRRYDKSTHKDVSPRGMVSRGSPAKKSERSRTPQNDTIPRPPTRPSRENTPSLGPAFAEDNVVIQSNLSNLQLSPEKRTKLEGRDTATEQHCQGAHDSSPARPARRLPTPAPTGLGIVPDINAIDPSRAEKVQTSRTPSPASSTSSRLRFGFFSRQKRVTVVDANEAAVNDKTSRRGPAAGTGHEGYYLHAARGRSRSTISRDNRPGGAAYSSDGNISDVAHRGLVQKTSEPARPRVDGEPADFGGGTSKDVSRTDSTHGQLSSSRPSVDSRLNFDVDGSELHRSTVRPPETSCRALRSRSSTSVSRNYESSNDDASTGMSSLVNEHLHTNADKAYETVRRPSERELTRTLALITSGKVSGSVHTSSKPTLRDAKKLTKRPASPRRWNPFKRSNSTPAPPSEVLISVGTEIRFDKPVAFYEILDSSEETGEESVGIEEILKDAHIAGAFPLPQPEYQPHFNDDLIKAPKLNVEVPSPLTLPDLWKAADDTTVTTESESAVRTRMARPSRLPHVGRIPKVVTARPEQTSPKSFSRPFARFSMDQAAAPPLSVIDKQSIALGPVSGPSEVPQTARNTEDLIMPEDSSEQQRAFLVISPRKGSVATTSSSSQTTSRPSITAIVPSPNAALGEDEVWDEYDDLITHPHKNVPDSAILAQGAPFQWENLDSTRAGRRHRTKRSSSAVDPHTVEKLRATEQKPPRLQLTSSSVYSPDLSTQIREAFANIPSPSTPFSPSSFGDYLASYEERNNSARSSAESRSGTGNSALPGLDKTSSTNLVERSQTIEWPTQSVQLDVRRAADYNLRLGSMTVSKWLTFGHVLFSPCREHLLSHDPAKHHSILVMDGLGNDDWSFYAAETYPTITFYNLSATRSPRANVQSSPYMPQTPTNHKQVQHSDPLARVPFPREFFSCVVARFPSAASEALLKHLVSEAKRVLRPSGYIELSILDLDMINMGTRCRRALRALKIQLSIAQPNINLGSSSDTILRELGNKNFVDVKSCRVGIPVTSLVKGSKSPDQEISLTDMMKDETEEGDNNITKMVAKIGRWWWGRCYESAALPNDGTGISIWQDEKLLAECQKWSTSFRLLVCYARKPAVGRRRTASV